MCAARPLITALFACAFVVASPLSGQPPAGKDKKADPDLARIQGDWVITKIEEVPGRQSPPPEVLKDILVTVRGDVISAKFTGELAKKAPAMSGSLVLNSAKSPREFDLTPLDEKGQPRREQIKGANGKVDDFGPSPISKGLYRLDGDTAVLCVSGAARTPRPTEFKVAPPKDPKSFRADDQGYMLVHLTRKK